MPKAHGHQLLRFSKVVGGFTVVGWKIAVSVHIDRACFARFSTQKIMHGHACHFAFDIPQRCMRNVDSWVRYVRKSLN